MILKAAWIVPVAAPCVRNGFVEIADDRIVRVGRAARDLPIDADVCDLGDVVLIPGLVNPHTHLELTCYAGQLEPAPFWPWIERLIELRRAPGQVEREAAAVEDGAWQSLRAGVTCVGDISRRNIAWRRLKQTPIRKVSFVEMISRADHAPRNAAELRAGLEEVAEDALLTAGVSAHAPYSVQAEDIRATVALADELKRPWCTHWAETREEVAFLRGRPQDRPELLNRVLEQCGVPSPRVSPLRYLERCASGLRPGALAHANYVDEAEIACLAEAGHVVVYCPRAHQFFGHSPHPFQRLRSAGVRVAIGTDSVASNDDLSMLAELRHVHEHIPEPPEPAELLRMATLDAAVALGLQEHIGSLEAGKQADLAAFACAPDEPDPLAALIARPLPLRNIWVAGEALDSRLGLA